MTKDYYKVLGVDKNASKEDIKAAYKRLAKKYHPDINKDHGATDKFKEINEAASILGDDKKKANYDQFGTAEGFQGGAGFSGFDYGDFASFGSSFDFDDIFETFFSGGGRGFRGRRARRGADLQMDLEIDLEEAAKGIKKHIEIPRMAVCPHCKGSGADSKSDIEACDRCNGSGMFTRQQRTPFGIFQTTSTCSVCRGAGRVIKNKCSECRGAGRIRKTDKISVDIPAGVGTGTRLRVEGEGEAGEDGYTSGDLYVVLHVKEHEVFERHEDDIYVEVPVSFAQACFGGEIEAPTLDGRAKIKIPQGTQTSTIFRLKGKGIPHLRGYGSGDENVKVAIETPKRLTKRQRELLEEFEKISEENPQKSFFDRIKDAF